MKTTVYRGVLLMGLAFVSGPALADYVSGLNPYGDNFLALRQYPSARSRLIARLGPNTIVEVLDADGVWRYVRTQDGLIGWAHGNWIFPGMPAYGGGGAPDMGGTAPDLGSPDLGGPINDAPQPVQPQPVGPQVGSAPVNVLPPAPDPVQQPAVSSAPAVSGSLDWLESHLEKFHDPLKYYPD
nr:SH3 domain-containing protein [uncultured Cohaesibacter sp.]